MIATGECPRRVCSGRLSYYGHSNAAVLNGGWDRWEEEGRPISKASTRLHHPLYTPSQYQAFLPNFPGCKPILTTPTLSSSTRAPPMNMPHGHLPNAITWDWMNGVPVEGWDTVRPADELAD